jgi:23S rRNA pseudouridine1911/1915/1917 synthase
MRIAIDWTFEMIGNLVLFEDNHLLAMVKPTGMLTQADRTGDICLTDLAKRYLAEKYAKPGDVYLGLVHRLDRPVGGVIVFARTGKAASRLSEQFRQRNTKKIYRALVEGIPKLPFGELTHYLAKSGTMMKVAYPETPGAQEARLLFRTLEIGVETSLVEVQLITGRKHQIRAQLAEIGCPIVGDIKYGAKQVPGDRRRAGDVVKGIMLWAYSVTLTHPTTGAEMTFTAPMPKTFTTKKVYDPGPRWDTAPE